jgi:biotin transport system substrate-specific component
MLQIFLGALFLALISQVAIYLPGTPIPITLQVFGVFLLILMQGRNQSTLSILFYLLLATCGLPVLAGGKANAWWMLKPNGGYLFGFVAAAWVSGFLLERVVKPSWLWVIFSLTCGQLLILGIGAGWLIYFVGFSKALEIGVKPFWMGGFIKMAAAILCYKCWKLFLKNKNKQIKTKENT